MNTIKTPKEFFGFTPGDDREMARWDMIVEYFRMLDQASERIKVIDMGPSTEGWPFLQVIITSEENMKNLEEIRQTSMKLADPRGLSQDEIEALVKKGKAVSVQSMSLHAIEIGGTQMSVNLAYDMITGNDPQLMNILENVVFVMVPCFNPDGQIMLTDWYYENKDTEFEGCNNPMLYHKYTGHDNNRDAFAHNIVESRYMGDILFHQWMPQSYQDHHHQGSYGARINIAPYTNPLRPYTDPLVWRELNLYGAGMAYHMESQGLDGVSTGAKFPSWGHYGYHWITNSHNIAGMLTESANCKLASPKYIDPTQLEGDGDITQPEYEAQTNFTAPWKGGWWTLKGITDRQYHAAYGLLDTMAKNREMILRNMAKKALNQTQRGEESKEYAYIIPQQHDKSELLHLIWMLREQNIEVKKAVKPFTVGAATYPEGTFVVFLAQPKLGVIMNLLGEYKHVDNQWTRDKNGAHVAFDAATDAVAEYMNINCIPAMQKFEGEFEIVDELEEEPVPAGNKFMLTARENSSYRAVNQLLNAGIKVYRKNNCPWHSFYVEGDEAQLKEILTEADCFPKPVEEAPEMTEVKPLKVGVYQRYYNGNADEGWTRLVLENYNFAYTTVMDKDVLDGLKDIDVLILPSDYSPIMLGPDKVPADGFTKMYLSWVGPQPPAYRSGFGMEGVQKIKEFVERGGRLLCLNKSCDFAIDYLGLKVKNVVKGLPLTQFNTNGSTLRAVVDNKDCAAWGMKQDSLIFHWNAPVFQVTDMFAAENYKTVVSIADKNVLKGGLLTGEALIAGKAAMMRCKLGEGEVVLYGMGVQNRAQTTGTFKLLFNMLYDYEK